MRYWVGLRVDKWLNMAPVDTSLFQAYAAGYPDRATYGDCVIANRTDNHLWENVPCSDNSYKYLPFCQKLMGQLNLQDKSCDR